jgi:hypothetical protein
MLRIDIVDLFPCKRISSKIRGKTINIMNGGLEFKERNQTDRGLELE